MSRFSHETFSMNYFLSEIIDENYFPDDHNMDFEELFDQRKRSIDEDDIESDESQFLYPTYLRFALFSDNITFVKSNIIVSFFSGNILIIIVTSEILMVIIYITILVQNYLNENKAAYSRIISLIKITCVFKCFMVVYEIKDSVSTCIYSKAHVNTGKMKKRRWLHPNYGIRVSYFWSGIIKYI